MPITSSLEAQLSSVIIYTLRHLMDPMPEKGNLLKQIENPITDLL